MDTQRRALERAIDDPHAALRLMIERSRVGAVSAPSCAASLGEDSAVVSGDGDGYGYGNGYGYRDGGI